MIFDQLLTGFALWGTGSLSHFIWIAGYVPVDSRKPSHADLHRFYFTDSNHCSFDT